MKRDSNCNKCIKESEATGGGRGEDEQAEEKAVESQEGRNEN